MTSGRVSRSILRTVGLFVGALVAAGEIFAAAPPKPADLLQVAARLESDNSTSGTLTLECRVASGWHVNSHNPSEDYLIATEVRVETGGSVSASAPAYPAGSLEKFAFADKPLSVYQGLFTVVVPVSWVGSPPVSLPGSVAFQACNDRQCLAPASVSFSAARTEVSAAGAPAPRSLAGGAIALSQAPFASSSASTGSTATAGASRDFGDLLSRRGIVFVLLLLFAGGLALNLTPCVYPVIPLTIGFFGGQSSAQGRKPFGLAALYVLGMATMYSALGVAAALSGRLFGAALQSPWVLGGVAAVLAALALSMFGLYHIRMPSFLMQKAGARAGAAGAYAMGLLVGVVAAPCVGPFVLGLLAFVAARQSAPLGFLLFFVLSLGLGFPYLFLAAFSGSLARLPRAGMWMEGFKKVFGWILLAMAAYFLRTAIPGPAGGWLLPVVLSIGALWLAASSASLRLILRLPAALLFVAAALFFLPHRPESFAAPDWQPYLESHVANTRRPAVIDFSATWCAPCLELDHKTFSDARVRRALGRRALYKADMTRTASPEVVALSRKYDVLGVPTIIFLDASGQERRELRLVGFEEPDAFLARLEKAP